MNEDDTNAIPLFEAFEKDTLSQITSKSEDKIILKVLLMKKTERQRKYS